MEKIIVGLLVLLQVELAAAILYAVLQKKSITSQRNKGACLVDTSTLIDGRILSIAETGFAPQTMLVHENVLKELQYLADNGDSDKRQRARHGLDVAKRLMEISPRSRIIHASTESSEVDDILLELARKYSGSICTIDFNLNKVAKAEGIPVINVNELAKNLRMNFLPGEKVSLLISQKGNDATQGVGYMTDGTMVVVEQAKKYIGQTVAIEFIRSIQTDAGRMLFAKLIDETVKADTKANPTKQKSSGRSAGTKAAKKQKRNSEDRLVELANQ